MIDVNHLQPDPFSVAFVFSRAWRVWKLGSREALVGLPSAGVLMGRRVILHQLRLRAGRRQHPDLWESNARQSIYALKEDQVAYLILDPIVFTIDLITVPTTFPSLDKMSNSPFSCRRDSRCLTYLTLGFDPGMGPKYADFTEQSACLSSPRQCCREAT